MADQALQPGVEVIQVKAKASPTFLRPTLVPVVVGPAFQVVDVVNADGSVSSDAKFGAYGQLGKSITETSFPDPRSNIDELSFLQATIRPFMLFGGSLRELLMSPGEAFLATAHYANKAVMKTADFGGGLALDGKVLILSVDNPVRTDTSKDITVQFVGTITAQQACDQINTAVGKTVATVVSTTFVQIASPTYGARSSLTVRQGGSANALLALGYVSASAAHEERVEGAGFRGQDQTNGTQVTPYIEFYRGGYILDGAAAADGVSSRMGWIGVAAGSTFVTSRTAAVTFGPSGTIPVQVGDVMYGDGVQVLSGEIMKVESTRLKIGTVDAALSVADSNGRYVSKVYDVATVGIPTSPTGFSPTFVWFKATGIDWTKAVPTPAVVTGTGEGQAATAAICAGGIITTPVSLAGLTLDYSVIINGVQTDGTYTFSGGPFGSTAAIATAIGTSIPGVTAASVGGGQLQFSTTLTGAQQGLIIHNTGTASTAVGYGTAVSSTGKDVELRATYTSGVTTFPTTALTGTHLDFEFSTDGGLTWGSTLVHNFVGEMAGAGALASDFMSDMAFNPVFTFDTNAGTLIVTSLNENSHFQFRVASTSTAIGTNKLNGIVSHDTSSNSLNGTTLSFTLDDNPHVYTTTFVSNSIEQAAADINHMIGTTVASTLPGSFTRKMKLTSFLSGLASKVLVSAGAATTLLGLSTSAAVGSGRPLPTAYLDASNNLIIGSEIIRDAITGYPLDQTSNQATLYIQYKALRKDVSPLAEIAGVLRISDQATLSASLSPLTDDNPLGLGMFLAMINAPTFEVKGLGIDEVSGAAPDGTEEAWARAADMLMAEEVYAIAPLTQNEVVHQIWGTHVLVMSEPEQGGERIVFINKVVPTETTPNTVSSGTMAGSTTTQNQLQLDSSPSAGLAAAGINAALPLDIDNAVYAEFSVNGQLRRYLITNVSGSLVTFQTTFTGTDNADGYYTVTPLTETVIDAPYSIKVRGVPLIIPGTTPPRTDYSKLADTVSGASGSIKNRRVFNVFPDKVKTTIAGVEKTLPGYYACAAIVGMVAAQRPQQGFTNFPITGLTGVVLTGPADKKFTKPMLNTIAGGGTYILQQEVQGGAVTCRQQLSTDRTSIEAAELSITKVVDFTAKFVRGGVRKYIGVENVTKDLLDSISTTINGMLAFLIENGVLVGANLNNIVQDKTAPDTVLVDITLQVPYPCNFIRITLSI